MSLIKRLGCSRVCVVAALPHEFRSADCYTGIGKLNAAINLSGYIKTHRPSLVINVGSCGSRNNELKNKVVRVSQFVEWDKELIKGFEAPMVLEENNTLNLPYQKVVCGTGDRFFNEDVYYHEFFLQDRRSADIDCDIFDMHIFDMEAYALAKTCQVNDIQFLSLKYVSDSGCIDQWEESLPKIHLIFEEVLINILESV